MGENQGEKMTKLRNIKRSNKKKQDSENKKKRCKKN